MRLHYNISTGAFTDGWGANTAPRAEDLKIKRGDGLAIEFVPFTSPGPPQATKYPLLALTCGFFNPGAFGSGAMFGADTFTELEEEVDGVAAARLVYRGRPSSNTLQVTARFAGMTDVTSVAPGASYALLANDTGNLVAMTHSSAMELTLGTAIAVGASCVVLNNSTGQGLTLAEGSGISDITYTDVEETITAGTMRRLTRNSATAWTVTAVTEAESISVALEFEWAESGEPVSTDTLSITLLNHYIREGAATPELAGEITNYYTKTVSDSRFLQLDGSQTLTTEQAAQLRENLDIEGYNEVVDDVEAVTAAQAATAASLATLSGNVIRLDQDDTTQTLTADQKAQTLAKLGARSASTQASIDEAKLGRADTVASHSSAQRENMRKVLRAMPLVQAPRRISRYLANRTAAEVQDYTDNGGTTAYVPGSLYMADGPAATVTTVALGTNLIISNPLWTWLDANDDFIPQAIEVQILGASAYGIDPAQWYRIAAIGSAYNMTLQDPAEDPGVTLPITANGSSFTCYFRRSFPGRYSHARRVTGSGAGSSISFRDSAPRHYYATNGRTELRAIVNFGEHVDSATNAFGGDTVDFRAFVGLAPSGAISNANPSTVANLLGIGFDVGDDRLSIISNGTKTATTVPILREIDFGGSLAYYNPLFALTLIIDPDDIDIGAGKIQVRIDTIGAQHEEIRSVYSAVVTPSTLPDVFALLAPQAWINNGSAGGVKQINLSMMEITQ